MTRVHQVTRDSLPESKRETYDKLIELSRGTAPVGPGAIAAHSPEMAVRRAPFSNYLRWETTLPSPILELAALTAARCMDCSYVWNAHAAHARTVGVSGALLDALRDHQPLPPGDDDQTSMVRYALELFTTHHVREETFNDAITRFGTQHLVEITAILGQYVQNAFFLNAFAVDIEAHPTEPPLPV